MSGRGGAPCSEGRSNQLGFPGAEWEGWEGLRDRRGVQSESLTLGWGAASEGAI